MEQTLSNETKPRIYVAYLAAYNNGHLHGARIDATHEAWAIYDDIAAMLRKSPIAEAEEWVIHAYEGFEGVGIAEYEGIDRVAELAAFIATHGKLGAELITYYGDISEARDALEDRYAGRYDSLADFARGLTEDTTSIPESLRFYIDYDRMAQDMAISDVVAIQTGHETVHVFWSH